MIAMRRVPIGAAILLAALLFGQSRACAAIIAEYQFENNALDTSGNNEHGTLMNGAGFSTGIFGQGLSLDGINDFVHVNFGNYNLSNFTIEL
jgi:hypothetical protein